MPCIKSTPRRCRRSWSGSGVKPDEAADIVQETYYRIQQAGRVEEIRNPRAFLFRVANNIRFNERKRRRNTIERQALDIESVELASDTPSAYRSFKGEQDLELVRIAFEELGETCREAFVMNRFEGLTFTQIATRLEISVSMVEKHVAHAVLHMKNRLEESQHAAKQISPGVLK
ncbi:MAG: sigma-70 family RNA polymerase sigma factor [Gammaproteobacteria bacterium]